MTGVDVAHVGRWYDEQTSTVEAEAIRRYAEATNDDNPTYRGDEPVAPPLFAIVTAWPSVARCMADVLPPDLLARIVHQSQDMRFERAVRAGETIRSRARVLGVQGGPRATTIVAQVESRDAHGAPAGTFWSTIYLREGKQPTAGEPAPELGAPALSGPVHTVEQRVDDDQAVRYAEASGDLNPIHTDDAAAKAAGLPGVILHGMCTLAFACRAAVDTLAGRDPGRVRRFGGRFSRPVVPGQSLATAFSPAGQGRFAFETTVDGRVVVRDGVVEVG